jgi:hypothetical protein
MEMAEVHYYIDCENCDAYYDVISADCGIEQLSRGPRECKCKVCRDIVTKEPIDCRAARIDFGRNKCSKFYPKQPGNG